MIWDPKRSQLFIGERGTKSLSPMPSFLDKNLPFLNAKVIEASQIKGCDPQFKDFFPIWLDNTNEN